MRQTEIDFSPHFARAGSQAFAGRHATMPWSGNMPIVRDKLDDTWNMLRHTQHLPLRPRLLYVHIPFCVTHCHFCAFYQNRYSASASEGYVEYLLRELEMEAASPLHQSRPIEAIYLGGGTPSALSAQSLARILTSLRKKLPLADDCEITIEGRVLNFDEQRIAACLDAGANRFSIGIQSFDTQIRKQMGRTSEGKEAARFLARLCRHDSATVVCDLLFGLPGQNLENWRQDLRQANELGLDGVDLYALNLFPNTQLGRAVASGSVTIPGYAECRDMYLEGNQFFRAAQWHSLSNSHWGRTTKERNRYNLAMKFGADCLSLGSAAGGSVNGYSWMQERALDRYYQAIDQGRKPLMMMMRPMETDFAWRQTLQGGIETGHVNLKQLTPDAARLLPLIRQWHACGLLEDSSTDLKLNDEGRFWASNLLNSLQILIAEMHGAAGAVPPHHPAMAHGHGMPAHPPRHTSSASTPDSTARERGHESIASLIQIS